MVRSICRALQSAQGSRRLLPFSAQRCRRPVLAGPLVQQPIVRSLASYVEPHHDADLRRIFDSKSFWDEFRNGQHASTFPPPSRKGLIQNHFLTEPRGFLRFAEDTRQRSQRLVNRIIAADSVEEYKALPRIFDRLSDALCRVLDVADFVRAVHPDKRFQEAAAKAYAKLWEYMNVLNTTPGLNEKLGKAISNPEVSSTWTEEELTVAKILQKDFSVSAIDLPQDQRKQFVKLSNDMKSIGHQFLEGMYPATVLIDFDSSQLRGLDPLVMARYNSDRGKVSLPAAGEDAHAALCSIHDADVRRQIYVAGRQATEHQIEILEALLQTRADIATLSGFQSYAEMSLVDKLAKSPEAVNSFLKALSADNGPYVKKELADLRASSGDVNSSMQAWDVLYYQSLRNSQLKSKSRKPDFLAAYFSLGTVMQGLSRLFHRLYGVRFVPHQTSPGEVWTPDVRRLDVVHETEGHVAVLYCDLFAREGKAPNPAHFTLRCSRRISPEEPREETPDATYAQEGVAISRAGDLYQVPTIALICDFSRPRTSNAPTLLPFRDVQTLFHEMGHALHSILGRTSLQVVSGTRCPTDFAELPSVLMEYFAADPSVLSLYARHWESDSPLPYTLVEEELALQKRWQGIQTETQIQISLLDQAYHSPLGKKMTGRSNTCTKLYHDISKRYGHIHEPPQTTPQAFFGHLVEYGGHYYSYLFDSAIAGKIWRDVFRSGQDGGALDRDAGERYKDEVLKWGGGRSGWACISGVLGDPRLRDGGTEAMKEVGKWGVHH